MTGLGAAAGGIFALSDYIIKLYQFPFAENANLFVILPEERIACSGEEEDQLLQEGKKPDTFAAQVFSLFTFILDFILIQYRTKRTL